MSNEVEKPDSILDELANIPAEPSEPENANIELDDEQLANASVDDVVGMFTQQEKEPEPQPEETPDEGTPEPEPEQNPGADQEEVEAEQADDFTDREKGLYAQKNRYKSKADRLEEENQRLKQQMEELSAKPQQSQQPDSDIEPDDEDDFLTKGDFESQLNQAIERKQAEMTRAVQERAGQADQVGRDFYDDYDDVVQADVISQLDPNTRQAIQAQPTPGRMAKAAYEACKQLVGSQMPSQPEPKQPNPVIPQSPQPPSVLTDAHMQHIQNRINQAQTPEEINAIQQELEGKYGKIG